MRLSPLTRSPPADVQHTRHTIAHPIALTLIGLGLLTGGLHALVGCTPSVSPTVHGPRMASDVAIDQRANGKQLRMSSGQNLVIALPDNSGSTGYVWTLGAYDAAILQEQGNPQRTPSTNLAPGAQGTITFCFKAVRTGRTPVTLKLRRPWEPGIAINTFYVLATVQ